MKIRIIGGDLGKDNQFFLSFPEIRKEEYSAWQDNPPTAAWQRLAASEAKSWTYFLPDIVEQTEPERETLQSCSERLCTV